jgi:hypothetical protein
VLDLPFYGPNRRTATEAGIDMVMRHFFAGLGLSGGAGPAGETVCEDDILDFYAGQ